MEFPPDEWEILGNEEFMTTVAHETTRPLTAESLLQINSNGKADGNFRIVLGKKEKS